MPALGFSISGARLGLPDTGYISYGEMVDQGRLITQAVSIPVIGDADNGYGNAMNVKRTVKGFIQAGFAGIFIEDQVHIYCLSDFNLVLVSSRLECTCVLALHKATDELVPVSLHAISLSPCLCLTNLLFQGGSESLWSYSWQESAVQGGSGYEYQSSN